MNVTTNDKIYDFNQAYYLMLATGPVNANGLFNSFVMYLDSLEEEIICSEITDGYWHLEPKSRNKTIRKQVK